MLANLKFTKLRFILKFRPKWFHLQNRLQDGVREPTMLCLRGQVCREDGVVRALADGALAAGQSVGTSRRSGVDFANLHFGRIIFAQCFYPFM
jgi:hypothetical protein